MTVGKGKRPPGPKKAGRFPLSIERIVDPHLQGFCIDIRASIRAGLATAVVVAQSAAL
jgi:hypothetical protein